MSIDWFNGILYLLGEKLSFRIDKIMFIILNMIENNWRMLGWYFMFYIFCFNDVYMGYFW